MPGPPPALAACRVAVRRWLRTYLAPAGEVPRSSAPAEGAAGGAVGGAAEGAVEEGAGLVLVACSGGADSLALAAAAAFVVPREGLRVGAVVVDHGLQDRSAGVAAEVAARLRGLGLDPVEVAAASVASSAAGPEADARAARYAVLADVAGRWQARAVLVGHTLDDQAEQVLLGLARGSGARSLAGMPPARVLDGSPANPGVRSEGGQGNQGVRSEGGQGNQGVRSDGMGGGGGVPLLGRPLLGVGRATTVQACAELGLEPWQDPHNTDPRFARVRARRALADLEADLGPGLTSGLARTADLLRDDAEALDAAAQAAYRELGDQPWPVTRLHPLPRAVRTRLWRRLALGLGSPGTDLTSQHLLAVDTLVTAWHGQGPLPLPGGVRAHREGDGVWLAGPRS